MNKISWFNSNIDVHERAFARVKNICLGHISGDSIVWGSVTLTKPNKFVFTINNEKELDYAQSIFLKKELEAATKYVTNYNMIKKDLGD